ncbi:hypothetical protein MBLNU457_6192t1 [Dothideomycetes sp. NU457]
MGYLSILPDHLCTIETWLARIFLLLGTVTMGPWILVLIYDIVLYAWRLATYSIGVGEHGRHRPRAPSLTRRPSGHRDRFSFAGLDLKSRIGEDEKHEDQQLGEMPAKRHDSVGMD